MDSVIELKKVSKKFRLYPRPIDRLKESLHPLRKRFHHEHWALKEISFSVARGETIGIMGRNGAGKSTLLHLITSVLEPSEGEVLVQGRVSALLELGAGFNPEMSGRENVLAQSLLMGMSRREMALKLPEIEGFADIGKYIDQPVKTYSSGMFVRLAFAMFISVEPDILIIDEALAVGDAAFQEKCFRKLKEFKDQGKTFILVSHSASLISQLCDRVLIIEEGNIYFEGDTQTGLIEYGKLMFGSKLPNDSEVTLRRVVSKKSPMPYEDIVDALSEWGNSGFDGEERFSLGPGYNKNEIRSGNQVAKIVDYKILVGGEIIPSSQLSILDDVSIYIMVFFGGEVPEPRLAITVSTLAGVLLYDVNTEMKSFFVPPGHKGEVAIYGFSFRNVLSKGSYVFSLWLVSEEMDGVNRLDSRESSIILESLGSEKFNGLFDMDIKISQFGRSFT
jgi:lipopolysaccharide transport system ATP-binding protein